MNFKKEKSLREKVVDLITEHYGLEIGEEFEIEDSGYNPYKFTSDSLIDKHEDDSSHWLSGLITGETKIKKLPKKPRLNDAERVILENLPKECKWIARDEDEEIRIFDNKPFKESGYDICYWRNTGEYPLSIIVFKHLFKFIQWKDKEPYNIEELLKEE